jgi:hypothetical protein
MGWQAGVEPSFRAVTERPRYRTSTATTSPSGENRTPDNEHPKLVLYQSELRSDSQGARSRTATASSRTRRATTNTSPWSERRESNPVYEHPMLVCNQ